MVERNDDDIKAIIEAEADFWHLVETNTPPPVDGSASCAAALSAQYKGGDPNLTILLPSDADGVIKSLESDKAIMESLKKQITEKENRLKVILGNAEEGSTDHYRVLWKSQAGRSSVPLAKIKKNAPDIYRLLEDKGYITMGKPTRRFSIKAND